MTVKKDIQNMNAMILKGKAMEAFEKYYADNVVMQENENPPTVGKDANREREKQFFENIKKIHGAEVKAVTVGDGVSMVEWFMDFTSKDGKRKKLNEVTVQRWKNRKIVHEKFYYDSNPAGN